MSTRFTGSWRSAGSPVPRLHGYVTARGGLDCILMDRVPGRSDFAGTSDTERNAVVDQYLQQLARLHATDPAPFIDGKLAAIIDLEAIKRHHFVACMGNQLQFGAAVANPGPNTDVMTFMQWNSETCAPTWHSDRRARQ
jgi:hypothetical protein